MFLEMTLSSTDCQFGNSSLSKLVAFKRHMTWTQVVSLDS